jgi:hypothetical protein
MPSLTLGDTRKSDGQGSVVTAALDGDGDIDLVSAGNTALTVYFQTSPGVFDPGRR